MIYNDNDTYMFDTNLKNKGFDPSNKFTFLGHILLHLDLYNLLK